MIFEILVDTKTHLVQLLENDTIIIQRREVGAEKTAWNPAGVPAYDVPSVTLEEAFEELDALDNKGQCGVGCEYCSKVP